MPRGGKRKGAGRPKGKPTIRISVPKYLLEKIKTFIRECLKKN